MIWGVQSSTVEGAPRVPGDKSIAHRAVLLAGLAAGRSTIDNLPAGGDVASTLRCVRLLGAGAEITENRAVILSAGYLHPPGTDLDAGNSGTTMRLLAGILAGQPFDSRIVGDESLSRRPMARVVEPLKRMGASIDAAGGRAPLAIRGRPLHGIRYVLPVASAQVKSAVLLAGLFAAGETSVVESVPTRDHTERMLGAVGVEVRREGGAATVGPARPSPLSLSIPGDPSTAAFLWAAAALTAGAVTVRGVCVNPLRIGFLRALEMMGGVVTVSNRREELGEPVADVCVSGRITDPIELGAADVPAIVDEIPLLVLLATQARGFSRITGAGELRVKESDRIATVGIALRAMGADIEERPDGFVIRGPTRLVGRDLTSSGDHRVAMMLAVAGTVAGGETRVAEAQAAAISVPDFPGMLRSVGGRIAVG